MKRLDLDFHRDSTTPRRAAGWLLLLAALAAVISLVASHNDLKEEQQRTKAALAQQYKRSPEAPNATDNIELEPQLKQAAAAIEQLSFPWDKLFRALESSMNEDIALLSVQPDVSGGTVTLNAEARDWDAMLDYIRRLNEDGFLTDVHLVSHQIQQADPQHPVRFMLSCNWPAPKSQPVP